MTAGQQIGYMQSPLNLRCMAAAELPAETALQISDQSQTGKTDHG